MSLAKAVVSGIVYRAPEKRFTSNNIPVTAFALNISDSEEQLVRVVARGKLAETMGDNISKGDKIVIEGRLQTNTVKSEDGSERKIVEIDASGYEAMGGSGSVSAPAASSKADSIVQFGEQPDFADELIGEDEIPF